MCIIHQDDTKDWQTEFEKSQLIQHIDKNSSKRQTGTQKHLLEVQMDKYYSLTKMEDFKNCMLEFLKQQEILRKQEMEKFGNQR